MEGGGRGLLRVVVASGEGVSLAHVLALHGFAMVAGARLLDDAAFRVHPHLPIGRLRDGVWSSARSL